MDQTRSAPSGASQPAVPIISPVPAEIADERTPLLDDNNNNGKMPRPQGSTEEGSTEEQTIVVDEVKGVRLWLILFTCWIGVFLGAIDSTVIATLSAPISSEFRSMSLLSWLATAYLISNAVSFWTLGRRQIGILT